MSISENFSVKSHLKEYSVEFWNDPADALSDELAREHVILIDRKVKYLHGKRLGVTDSQDTLEFNAVEQNKTLAATAGLAEKILGLGISKHTRLIVIGGGITQDVGAFTASMIYRGLEWVFLPTTLLAQADSCIGSKTSINVGVHKNQLGNFCPPSRVIISPIFLETLTLDDVKSGYGEIIKVHLIDGEKSFSRLESCYGSSLSDRDLRFGLIQHSLQIKKPFVEQDEFDTGLRNLLNYGHTFGHALESATNYQIAHGLAITSGMDIANFISLNRGLITREIFFRIRTLLRRNFPNLPDKKVLPSFLEALRKDKKNVSGKLMAILTEGPGRMKKVALPNDFDLENQIRQYYEEV